MQKAWVSTNRLGGLRRFAAAITGFTLLGHFWFGFEQSWAQPLVALLTAYLLEIGLEAVDAWSGRRPARFRGGPVAFVDFLLSAHITALAVSMLIYPNEALWPVVFAVTVAMGSKAILRVTVNGRARHFLNPSNFGITLTLLCFPWVGIAQPYHFTENLTGLGNWILPGIIVVSGTLLNARYTHRMPLLLTWVGVFALQAVVRSTFFGTPLIAPWLPITGVAFMLFTFYMVTDPATTPSGWKTQVGFGAAVAACYGLLVVFHIVFGLFFALTIVTALRGVGMALGARAPATAGAATRTATQTASSVVNAPAPAPAAPPARGSIAIVGMACHYPDAKTPAELWENVLARRRAFRRIPDERLRLADYHDADRLKPDRTYATQAAVIEGFEFDRVAYRVAGTTYRSADLAHWLALDVVHRALEDAGFADGEGLPRRATGVHLGNTLTGEFSRANVMRLRWPYVRRVVAAKLRETGWTDEQLLPFLGGLEAEYKRPFAPVGSESLAGGLSNTIAGRICNHFDLKGGGYTVDGACAASLLAVISSCTALRNGDLDVAIAGGVDLSLDPFELVGFAKTGALASDDMRVYDVRSQGFWPGEGSGFVVLMRADDAVAAGHRIYALIDGWGISSDGSGGITRPDLDGQRLALERAYDRAGYGIETVGYHEGHGTGTKVGDATELEVLSGARQAANRAAPAAAIGSIKANIGHTKAAAGVAGLIKATLALHHEVLPPTTGCEQPHPVFGEGALRVLDEAETWSGGPRRAAVSAMGFGGINTHIVLGAAVAPRTTPSSTPRTTRTTPLRYATQDAELFVFAGPDRGAVRTQVDRVATYAARLSSAELADLAAELAGVVVDADSVRTVRAGVRASVIAASAGELATRLETLATQLRSTGPAPHLDPDAGVFVASGATPPRIGFAFPGQGSPVHRQGGAFAQRFTVARELYDRLDLSLDEPDVSTRVAQPAIVTASMAALRVLESLGVEGTIAIGHSLGELTSLHWAGAFDGSALLRIATVRAAAMADLGSATGAMASLATDAAEAETLSAGAARVAGLNGPRQTVVSGEAADIEAIVRRARERGVQAARLPVSHAFHSPLVEAAVPALRRHLENEPFTPLTRAVASTVTGGVLAADADLVRLLCDQVVSPVRFREAARVAVAQTDLLIEVGPGHVLSGLLRDNEARVVLSVDAGGPSLRPMLGVLGAAWVLGAPVDHRGLYEGRLTRPFALDWSPRFLANPCEQAPTGEPAPVGELAPATSDETSVPAEAGVGVDRDGESEEDPRVVIRSLVASYAELPVESVGDDDRFLSDLHLNSLTVGQIMVEAARRLELPAPAAPTEYADSTVSEAAEALMTQAELATVGNGGPGRAPAGLESWVRAFTVRLHDRPAPPTSGVGDASGGPTGGRWQVLTEPAAQPFADHLAEALREATAEDGVIVCLPGCMACAHVAMLLQGARAALDARGKLRFVLVQPGAACSGLAKTLFLESPKTPTTVLDLSFDDARAIEWITREVTIGDGFREVVYDADGRRAEPFLEPLAEPVRGTHTPGDHPLGPDDVLLVTGGGKGITAECALDAARRTGVKLILLGRSRREDDAKLRANLDRFTTHGVRFRYVAADVTDADAVAEAVHVGQEDVGIVTAFVHGAGRNEPRLMSVLEQSDVTRTIEPKVDGLRHVLAALDPEALRLLVTFGSIIARTGLAGEADYAIANGMLAYETEDWGRTHPHCRCLVLEWSVWSGLGMGDRLGRVDALRERGITAIAPDVGLEFFDRLLRDPAPVTRVVVTGRYGEAPTLRPAPMELPLRRFLETPRVLYPDVELVVDAVLSPHKDPYLRDHVFNGRVLLPGVLGLEAMAQTAMALVETDATPVFTNVEFRRPIEVPADGEVTVRVAALVRGAGVVDVALRAGDTGFQFDHFRATCSFEPVDVDPFDADGPDADGSRLDLDAGLDPGRDLYGGILFQDGRFRRVAGYRTLRATECIVELETADEAAWFGPYQPGTLVLGSPGLRDAVIHAIQACIPHATLLPTAVDRIVLDTTPHDGGRCLVHARERSRDGAEFVYDVLVVDAEGTPRERWDGLHLRAVDEAPKPEAWAVPLVAPLFERRLQELLPDAGLTVAIDAAPAGDTGDRTQRATQEALHRRANLLRRPDGKREVADGGQAVTATHAGPLTFVIAGSGRIGCDAEPVRARATDDWRDLLGPERYELARLIAEERGETPDAAATRVWTAAECVKKAGLNPDTPLTLESTDRTDWIVLRAGHASIASAVLDIRGQDEPLAVAALADG